MPSSDNLSRALFAPVDPPLRPLPASVAELLLSLDAPPRLAAHLRAVHDVAVQLVDWVEQRYPDLDLDREAVLFGAATHDVGKAVHVAELSGPGSSHEKAGRELLLAHGFGPELARFAGTHGAWTGPAVTLEDLLVSTADKIWKNKRVPELEDLVVTRLVRATGREGEEGRKGQEGEEGREGWVERLAVDELLERIGGGADHRLAFQASFPAPVAGFAEGAEHPVVRFLREVAADVGIDAPEVERTVTPGDLDLYGLRCPDAEVADAVWLRLRALHPDTGLWPFLSHWSPTEWEWEEGRHAEPRPAESGVLAAIVASQERTVHESKMGALTPYARGELLARRFAHVPGGIWVCLIEADLPSTLPQLLHAPFTPGWGSDGPVPELGYDRHQAVLREWEIRYGAVLYYLACTDTLVLEVERPPTDRAEIARVAAEQYAYCLDLDQVVGGPEEVAERQVPSGHWFFWWD
ncbi:MAG: DUF4253 domain-containing protein [Streptomyces sp.]|nr:DUF4253 domain-containing protein [Streptomyces sp.]